MDSTLTHVRSIDDITHVFYINMDHRTDRKIHVEAELSKIGLNNNAVRFSGIKHEHGAVGCTMSHLTCLEYAKEHNWTHVMICEDDITFTDSVRFVAHLNKMMSSKIPWDVIMLGGTIIQPFAKINKSCVKLVGGCQTTTGYIVNGHYLDTLIQNVKCGLENLISCPSNKTEYAIDRYWLTLQRTGQWYLIIPLTVTQMDGYSDIEQKNVNYNHIMMPQLA